MAENGAFADLGPQPVAKVSYLGLGPSPKVVSTEITPDLVAEVWGGLHKLIGSYMSDDKGYTPRRALQKEGDVSDYDHLSRFGEWDMTDTPETGCWPMNINPASQRQIDAANPAASTWLAANAGRGKPRC